MRKKFMLVAALAGILSLGACVDDKESPSVEAIRNAKAEQLKAVAALNNAQAEATRLLAEAEATLKAIEAELKKVQVETDKVELEKKKAALALELAGQEQELEAKLLKAKADLEREKQNYLDALKGADDQVKARLATLLAEYTTAAQELIGLKNELAGEKRQLVQLEYSLIDAKTWKEQSLVRNNNDMAYLEIQKATYEKYSTVDKAEAKKAYEAASLEHEVLRNKALATNQKLNTANSKLNAASALLNNSAYRVKLNSVFMYSNYGNMYIRPITVDGVNYWGYNVTDEFGITTQIPMFTEDVREWTEIELIQDDQTVATQTYSYGTIKDFYAVKKEGFDSFIAAFGKSIKDNQEKAVKEAQDAYDAAVATEKVAKTNAEKEDATQQDKDDYLTAHYNTLSKKDDLDIATDALNTENEKLAEVKDAYDFITGKEQTDAVKAMADSYNALSKEVCDLNIQYGKEDYVARLKSNEVNALWNIYNGATDIVAAINSCNDQITYLKRQIADLSSIESAEEAIESAKVTISNLEVKITAKEKEVAVAKAAFEAAAKE